MEAIGEGETMQLDEITQRIIGCADEVSNTPGSHLVEKVYGNSLFRQLVKSSLQVTGQHLVNRFHDKV